MICKILKQDFLLFKLLWQTLILQICLFAFAFSMVDHEDFILNAMLKL